MKVESGRLVRDEERNRNQKNLSSRERETRRKKNAGPESYRRGA